MNFNSNQVYVVYASDDKFAEILGVSLLSLYENSKDLEDITVFILDSGIMEIDKEKIYSIAKTYHRTIPNFIQAKDITRELEMEVAVDRGSLSQYARLFISTNLPDCLHRVLYLDCDIIINKSIKELWNINLHGKTIGALMDAFSEKYRINIGLQPNDIMFNSGVMLIDLELWRSQRIEEKLMEFISSQNGNIQQGDQGALNAVLSHDTYCFPPRFNSVTIFYDFTYHDMLIYRKPPKFYSEDQVNEAVCNPDIIHFTTSFLSKRPWIKGCRHKYVGLWLKYKGMSPWKDKELWDDNCSNWKKGGICLYKLLPSKFALHFAGFMQAYARPLKNMIRSLLR